MNMIPKNMAATRFETKAAGDNAEDDLAEAIAGLAADVKKSQADLEAKVAKMVADALKPVTDAQLEIEKKAGRPFATARVAGDVDLDDEAKEQRLLLGMWFKEHFGGQMGRKTDHKAIMKQIDDMQSKSMQVGSDPDGGIFVEAVRSPIIRKRLVEGSAMRRLAHIETIPNGDAWEEPIDDDVAGAGWVGETEARPETSTSQVGLASWPLHEIYAAPTLTQKLLDLSYFDVGQWIEGKIGDRFSELESAAFISGNGIKKPRGILTYESTAEIDAVRAAGKLQFIVSGHATLITPDQLKALTWAVRAPYRQNARWLMNSQTAGAIDQLKDLNGQYIWRTGMGAGSPNTLLGYAVEFDESMPDVGAGTTPIAFGNFERGYLIVDWAGIRLIRDPYTNKPKVVFYAYKRVGGGLRDSEALKLLKTGT